MSRVAVVTGSNKGVGFAIVKGLCEKFDGIVYLTARDIGRGQDAVSELEKLGLKPKFHQLDINDNVSVNNFKDYLHKMHKGIDILVNNAAIAFKMNATEPFGVQATETIKVNYFGLKRVCNALFPLLKPHARVVHVSSSAGHLSRIPSESLRAQFANPNLTEQQLDALIQDFITKAQSNTHTDGGWPNSTYVVSKVGVSALTRIHQGMFDKDSREDIVVNSVHPGYVDTDMTSHKGEFTIERGAQAPLFCALLPPNTEIKGKYVWHDNTVIDWVTGTLPGAR